MKDLLQDYTAKDTEIENIRIGKKSEFRNSRTFQEAQFIIHLICCGARGGG